MVLLAALGAREQSGTGSVLEHFTDTLTRLGRTLEIVLGADLLGYRHTLHRRTEEAHERSAKWWNKAWNGTYLFGCDRALVRLTKLLDNAGVPPEILLAAYENDRQTSAEVHDLGNPL